MKKIVSSLAVVGALVTWGPCPDCGKTGACVEGDEEIALYLHIVGCPKRPVE